MEINFSARTYYQPLHCFYVISALTNNVGGCACNFRGFLSRCNYYIQTWYSKRTPESFCFQLTKCFSDN